MPGAFSSAFSSAFGSGPVNNGGIIWGSTSTQTVVFPGTVSGGIVFGGYSGSIVTPLHLTRVSTGLIYRSDGSLTGWSGDAAWTSTADLHFVCYPVVRQMAASFGLVDSQGIREGQVIQISSAIWVLIYDAGDGTHGWQQFWAKSVDRGFTWTYGGIYGPGYNKVSSGTWAATATGWTAVVNGTYYTNRVLASSVSSSPNQGLPNNPYFWDAWTGPANGDGTPPSTGSWTADPAVPIDTQYYHLGTPFATYLVPDNIWYDGSSLYYGFGDGPVSGTSNSIGVMTASSPDGPWSGALMTAVITGSTPGLNGLNSENSKTVWSSTFSKGVITMNHWQTNVANYSTTGVVASFSTTDIPNGVFRQTQRICGLDSPNAVGVPTPITSTNRGEVVGPNGEIPITYDGFPTGVSPGWHLGRKIIPAVLEPSAFCLQCLGNGDATNRAIFKAQTLTDCVIEFGICFLAASSPTVKFFFRSDATGANGYCLVLSGSSGGSGGTILQKVVSGSATTISSQTASNYIINFVHRVKITLSGSSITVMFDDTAATLTATDTSFASGNYIGLSEDNASVQVRNLTIRTSDTITVTGLTPGTPVNLRTYGALPVLQGSAGGSGHATFAPYHWPHWAIEVNGSGTDLTTSDGRLWGGDVLSLAQSPPPPPPNTLPGGCMSGGRMGGLRTGIFSGGRM